MSDIEIIIGSMIDNALANSDMLISTEKLLRNIRTLLPAPAIEKPVAVISCTAECINPTEINNTPRYRIAVKISNDDNTNLIYDKIIKTKYGHDVANLMSIYYALTSAFGLKNKYNGLVEIRCDYTNVIDALNGDIDEEEESQEFQERIQGILNYCKQLPCPISFIWRPQFFDFDMEEVTARARGK